MDVDLLRPGTVPISPDTILWFEFLLNPSLLLEHLSKPLPGLTKKIYVHIYLLLSRDTQWAINFTSLKHFVSDPSPTDLIIKFMTINLEQRDNNETKIVDIDGIETKQPAPCKWSHKNLALKILSLKVAAYLKWDLDTIETKLPLPMQISLLQDLFYIATDNVVEIPMTQEYPTSSMTDQVLFAVVLYHRWHLRAIVYKSLNSRQIKQPFIHM